MIIYICLCGRYANNVYHKFIVLKNDRTNTKGGAQMKYSEMGFRGIYRQLNALRLTDQLRKEITDFPDAGKANCVLTYGYIDHEAGLSMEILAAGITIRRFYEILRRC